MIKNILEKMLNSENLTEVEMIFVFEQIFSENLNSCQISSFLTAWRVRGEKALDLFAGALVMRRYAQIVAINKGSRPVVDNCGTGGDGSGSFNISTAAAIVAASCGEKIVKHGNRKISSACGSADFLFELGFPANLTSKQALELFEQKGFTFLFAPNFHPVMKTVMPVRNSLGFRTIFNLLGPLSNPVHPEYQVLGVGKESYLDPMAEALAKLGVSRACVVHSRDGMDEISPCVASEARWIEGGRVKKIVIEGQNICKKTKPSDLKGGDAKENAKIFNKFISGDDSGVGQAVLINAAAIVWVTGTKKNLEDSFSFVTSKLKNGDVEKYFHNFLETANNISKI